MSIFAPKTAEFYLGRKSAGPSQLAVVHITNVCNLHCTFCLERADRGGPQVPDIAEVRQTLAGLRAKGATDIVFMGAETLLRKDALDVIAAAHDAGFCHIKAATNGTPLAREGYLARLAHAGLNALEISIHGATAEVADRIAGVPHTFTRQARALADLAAIQSIDITVNTVICRENADSLAEIAAYVRQQIGPGRPIRFKFIFTHLLGCAWQNAKEQGPLRYADVDFVAVAERLAPLGEKFYFDNVPLCRLGRHAARSLKLKAFAGDETYFDRAVESNTYRSTGFQLGGQVWPAQPCGTCTLRPVCQGVEEQYARMAGKAELRAAALAPLVVLREALMLEGQDPRQAAGRLAALAQEPRPQGIVTPLRPGMVRLTHPQFAEPLELRIEPTQADKPCFARTPRFDVGYRPWEGGNATQHPRVRDALARAVATLQSADAEGCAIADARARVAKQVLPGWQGETA
jgi:uncharacterized Fe-S cluster-containing radical SAM superfamily protein